MDQKKVITYGFIIAITVVITLSIVYSNYTYILYGVVVLGLVYYYFFYSEDNTLDTLTTLTPLSAQKQIVMADKTQHTLLEKGSSTVIGFFNLQEGDRTKTYIDKLRPEEYVPVLQVVNNWYFEISQSPSGNQHTNARLRVTTKDSSGVATDEVIELPSIPKQKWMCIAILRDGRRFDVMYNYKIVTSQRLLNYPVVISNPLLLGNKSLSGSAIHIIISDRRFSPTEVDRERLKYVNTNNEIIESNAIDISFPNIRLFSQCPPGLPCDPVTKPPRNNLLQWKTPYA